MKLVAIQIATDRPHEMGTFYQQVLQLEPAWAAENVTGFMLGDFRLEIMAHSEVAGPNRQPQRMFFDFQVDDVRAEFERLVAMGAGVIQRPYNHVDDEINVTIATLADPDGNYFQLVTMN